MRRQVFTDIWSICPVPRATLPSTPTANASDECTVINVDFTSMTLFKLALPLARAKILAPLSLLSSLPLIWRGYPENLDGRGAH